MVLERKEFGHCDCHRCCKVKTTDIHGYSRFKSHQIILYVIGCSEEEPAWNIIQISQATTHSCLEKAPKIRPNASIVWEFLSELWISLKKLRVSWNNICRLDCRHWIKPHRGEHSNANGTLVSYPIPSHYSKSGTNHNFIQQMWT